MEPGLTQWQGKFWTYHDLRGWEKHSTVWHAEVSWGTDSSEFPATGFQAEPAQEPPLEGSWSTSASSWELPNSTITEPSTEPLVTGPTAESPAQEPTAEVTMEEVTPQLPILHPLFNGSWHYLARDIVQHLRWNCRNFWVNVVELADVFSIRLAVYRALSANPRVTYRWIGEGAARTRQVRAPTREELA